MQLTALQTDALGELGNIGAAHAATTLSQMLMSQIEMDVPAVSIIDISKFYSVIDDECAALVVFQITGEAHGQGYVVLYMPQKSAVCLTNTMLGMNDMDREINDMDQSALIEVGNIMVSAFLDATAELLGIVMLPSPPSLCVDMAHAGIQSILADVAQDTDEVVIFRTNLHNGQNEIEGTLLLFPDLTLLKNLVTLLESLTSPAQSS
ncbi:MULTISPECIES: chemotaxis protein CheC [Methanofollis]|jgi:chemotaxis protein CheC|uniref:chemotaxis protein CheC n=1 Tax=Methanofollis TaxID=81416 RepID=UPI00082DFDC6|nr:chemotaxis protein CheC [Methanofollis ethanolicus]